MSHIKFFPIGDKNARIYKTTHDVVNQVWQELVMLRHLGKNSSLAAPKSIASWIDQGKTYYLDAVKCNWRTSGLLYYYSFLNLAKALLVGKRRFTYKLMNSTSSHHGLSAELQDIKNILDYKIKIYPPNARNCNNIFSNLYEVILKEKWPFSNSITITLNDIVGYCLEIYGELRALTSFHAATFPVQSMIRFRDNKVWFEMIVPKHFENHIEENLNTIDFQKYSINQIDDFDKQEWHHAFFRSGFDLSNITFIRTPPVMANTNDEETKEYNKITSEVLSAFYKYAYHPLAVSELAPYWLFVSDITLNNTKLHWHPIFSDYLFSFMLGNVLRYQPQLLSDDDSNYFLSEAWCNQSSIAVLNYFLMQFSKPPLIITRY